jgi:flagellar biosynthesis protein FlhA
MLILYKGAAFDGYIIRFVSGLMFGSSGTEGLVVGIVIYLAIIIFMVFVFARGTVRNAEVAASIAFYSLPGKQMGIDNEYAQGAITEEERTAKMQELQQKSDLYGSMDGASKFISGILKILITITVITALVGILISIIFHGETILDAAIIYVPLALSSGIISMLPLLLFSIAVIMMVTRTTSSGKSNEE